MSELEKNEVFLEPEATSSETSDETDEGLIEEASETPSDSQPEDPLAALQLELQQAKADAEEWRAKAYRVSADMDNMRKRHLKEQSDQRKYAAEPILRALLPALDNLKRVIDHLQEHESAMAKGIEMVNRQFMNELQKFGAVPFSPKGEVFDPQKHEAMTQMPTDEVPPGHIFQVFQEGWMLHDRLVRPAMVVVAMAPVAPVVDVASPTESTEDDSSDPKGSTRPEENITIEGTNPEEKN